MLRSAPLLILGLLLALPVQAEEPPGDEPMHAQPPAKTAAPAQTAAPAVPPAAVTAGVNEEVIPNPPRVYGYAFGGAALGSLALSAILGGVALSKSGEQEGNVGSPPIYTRELRDSAEQGRALADTSYVFLGLGIALAVTDIVMWYEIFRKPRVIKRTAPAGGAQ